MSTYHTTQSTPCSRTLPTTPPSQHLVLGHYLPHHPVNTLFWDTRYLQQHPVNTFCDTAPTTSSQHLVLGPWVPTRPHQHLSLGPWVPTTIANQHIFLKHYVHTTTPTPFSRRITSLYCLQKSQKLQSKDDKGWLHPQRMTSDSPASLASGFSSMVAMMQSTISFLYSNPPWATHRQGCHLIKQQDNSPHSHSCTQTLPGQYTGCHLIKQPDTSPHTPSCTQTLPGQYTDTVSFNKTTRHLSAISFLYSNSPWHGVI